MIEAQPWPDTLRYFSALEFGRWAPYMDHEFLFRLDELRDRTGWRIMISPVNGSLGRTPKEFPEGSKTSQHYFDGTRYLRVADTQPHKSGGHPLDRDEMQYFTEIAKQIGFTGIGIYPHHKPFAGVHLDMRPGPIKTWGMLPIGVNDKQVEVSIAQAWRNWALYQA